jgi:hypothetical protein
MPTLRPHVRWSSDTKMTLRLALLAFTFLLAPSAYAEQAPMGSETRATLVFYRTPGWVGAAVRHVVMVNGQRAAKLRSKSYTTLSLKPGRYTVCIFGDELCVAPFEVVAGETYYIRDTSDASYAGSGNHAFSIYLSQVDANTGRTQSAGLKRVEPEAAFKPATPD